MPIKLPPKLTPEELELIKAYSIAQQNLIDTIAKKSTRGNVVSFEKSLLRQVDDELTKLKRFNSNWVVRYISKIYYATVREVNKYFTDSGINMPYPEIFSQINKDAVNLLIKNKLDDLNEACDFLSRRIKDEVRKVSLDTVTQKFLQGLTVKQAKQKLINNLIDNGIGAIKDKSGRVWQLDTYAQVVIRSTTAETQNTATIIQLKQNEFDLVKMSYHNSTCKICVVYENRVFSISGNDKRFPPLSIAFKGIYKSLHVSCKHRLMPYIEQFNDVEKDIEYSNRPFEVDPKSQAKVDSYNKVQNEKQKLRNDKRQWERYKLSGIDGVPSTLSAFRKSKYSNSKNWQELEHNYKSSRQSNAD